MSYYACLHMYIYNRQTTQNLMKRTFAEYALIYHKILNYTVLLYSICVQASSIQMKFYILMFFTNTIKN